MDVIEIDAASNRGIDEIRQLREQVNFVPAEGRYKIYIIDEVHMLTTEAFNALLKTIEEPPDFTVFILATTEAQKIPATILSRCQRLDFKRITAAEIKEHLKYIAGLEEVIIDERTLSYVARVADGSMRDSISLLDQLISYRGKQITFTDLLDLLGTTDFNSLAELVDILAARNLDSALKYLDNLLAAGRNMLQVNKELVDYLRNLLLAKLGAVKAIEVSDENLVKLQEQSKKFPLDELKKMLLLFSKAEADMRWQQNAKLIFELALIEICTNVKDQTLKFPEVNIKPKEVKPAEEKIIFPAAAVSPVAPVIQEQTAEPVKNFTDLEKKNPTISDIKAGWAQIINKVKMIKPKLFILICESEPAELTDSTLYLKFKENYGFHKEKLMLEENRSIVEGILTELYRKKMSLKLVLENELIKTAVPVQNPNPARSVPEKNTDPQTKKLMEMFQGKVAK